MNVEQTPKSTHQHHHHDHHHGPRMPFGRWFLITAIQVVLAFGIFWWISPTTLSDEFSKPWMMLFWTFIFGVPLSLFEYLYHRYLLHSAVLPFLGSMHRAHSEHHGLTYVKAPVTQKEPMKMVTVDNAYPIEEEEQEESMMFPTYAISIFLGLFLILLALPFKLMFPAQPIISSVMFTVTLAYTLYEAWHGVLHLPFERYWEPAMNHPRFGKTIRHIYGFHLMHHWRPTSNLAVVGFWGFAVWDHLFRTHRRPEHMPLDGALVSYEDAKLRKPLWPISSLDKIGASMYKGSRAIERWLAKVFLRRSTN